MFWFCFKVNLVPTFGSTEVFVVFKSCNQEYQTFLVSEYLTVYNNIVTSIA